MKTINILYEEGKEPKRCSSIEEMDRVLDEIHAAVPEDESLHTIAIINEADDEIVAGLGKDLSYLCFQVSPRDGEYYTSFGDEEPDDEVESYGIYRDTYWNSKVLIPMTAVRDAIRYFVTHGKRDPSVRWRDWEEKDVSV